jgi:hypothetical protein
MDFHTLRCHDVVHAGTRYYGGRVKTGDAERSRPAIASAPTVSRCVLRSEGRCRTPTWLPSWFSKRRQESMTISWTSRHDRQRGGMVIVKREEVCALAHDFQRCCRSPRQQRWGVVCARGSAESRSRRSMDGTAARAPAVTTI